jgi:hypothetical protein
VTGSRHPRRLPRVEGIEFTQVRHEEIAAFAACAHAKFTGEVGVCLATSGPLWLVDEPRAEGAPLFARPSRGLAPLAAGIAVVAPAVLGAAPRVGELPAGLAISAVTTVGYLGSFTGPPAIGALAELTSLSAALVLLVVACGVIVALARRAVP